MMRSIRGLWVVALLGLLFGSAPAELGATVEPYLSVRTGLPCSQCHTNRTGGGGRSEFGSVYAQAFLPAATRAFRGRSVNRFLSVGANFRLLASGVVSESTPRTTFELAEANVQVEASLVADVLSVYVDQTVGPGNAATREAFAILETLPANGYLKAGKFMLPFGMRLLDDDEFIRERTGFNHNTPDQGIELGLEPGPLSLFVAVTNGSQGASENNSGKQITTTGALIYPGFRIGASASRNDGPNARRDVVGGFGGFNLGRFTFLGEVDLIFDTPEGGDEVEQLAAYIEGDFLAARGVNLKVTYGFLDPNADIGENGKVRMRFGVEIFPMPFFQISTFYTMLEDIPQSTTDRDRLSVELHAYF